MQSMGPRFSWSFEKPNRKGNLWLTSQIHRDVKFLWITMGAGLGGFLVEVNSLSF